MYIIERIIGIIIFITILFIVAYFISNSNYKKIKHILIVYVICLGIMAFFYVPSTSADLYRTIELLATRYSEMNFSEICQILSITNFSSVLYYYIFAQSGIYHLLPCITAIIFYSNVFYIIYSYGKKNQTSSSNISKTIILFMLGGQFIEVISGIRCMMAFSIIALCFYREFYEKKSIISNIPLYVLAMGFHLASVPVFLIRIVYLLLQKEKNLVKKIINWILAVIIISLMAYYGQNLIEGASDKASYYINNNVYSYFWEYLIGILQILITILFFRIYKKNQKNYLANAYIANSKIFNISLIFLIVDICFAFEYSIFHRFILFLSMLILPVVMLSFQSLNNSITNSRLFIKKYEFLYYSLLVITFVLVCTRGNFTALKFFILK